MDYEFISKHLPMYIEAAKLTLGIATLGILGATILGFLCSLASYYKVPVLKKIAAIYIELSRNTPLLVQLFFLYYGLPKLGIVLPAKTCAIAGLIFLGGSYMAETFRSGLEAVAIIQSEAGLSLGLKRWQVLVYIVWPQALAVSLPGYSANVIFMIKETSAFSVIALADLMFVAKDLIGLYYKTDEALFMLVVAYLVILLPISLGLTVVERRIRHAGAWN